MIGSCYVLYGSHVVVVTKPSEGKHRTELVSFEELLSSGRS